MNIYIVFGLLLFGSYVVGSLNGARIREKVFGVKQDTQALGSGEAGATHTFRAVGIAAGIFVLVWDIVRGVGIAVVGKVLGLPDWAVLLCGIGGMAGHNWPAFFSLQGGKGMAIMGAVLLTLHPLSLLLVLIPTIPLFFFRKQMSGFLPFVATPVYIILQFFELPVYISWQYWNKETVDWKLVVVGVAILAVIFARRLNAGWKEFQIASSKRTSLRNILIYDRVGNNLLPRLRLVNWLLELISRILRLSPKPNASK